MVDPDLAADRAVDLGEQSRRHHDQGKPASERGRDKAGEVADHAASQGDDQRVAIGLATYQFIVQPRRLAERLGRLTRGNDRDRRLDPDLDKPAWYGAGRAQVRQMRIGDDQGGPARPTTPGPVERLTDEWAEAFGPPGDDANLVRTRAQVHLGAEIPYG